MPYPNSVVLPGVTRQVAFELAAREGIPTQTTSIHVTQLLDADEVFLTNSIMGVMPVCRVERSAIGDDKPGPTTRRLSKAYAELIAAKCGR